jgi:hypothetical protein
MADDRLGMLSFTFLVGMDDSPVFDRAQQKRERDRVYQRRCRDRKKQKAALARPDPDRADSEECQTADFFHSNGRPDADRADSTKEKRENFAPNGRLPSQANSAAEPAEGFDQFWQAFPRKVHKHAALAAWNWLAPNRLQREILLVTLELQKVSPEWADPANIPTAAAWLRDPEGEQAR